jgi:hypothetical protein
MILKKDTSELNILETCNLQNKSMEDLRLFDYNDTTWFTSCSRRKSDNYFESYLYNVGNDILDYNFRLEHTFSEPIAHVKNLVPLVTKQSQLYIIDVLQGIFYDYSCNMKSCKINNTMCEGLSGSTQFIPVDSDGTTYGALVHSFQIEPVTIDRYYKHYWIEIDISTWTFTYLSEPFLLNTYGIEFASGIEKIDDTCVQILYGSNDKTSYTCITTFANLRI